MAEPRQVHKFRRANFRWLLEQKFGGTEKSQQEIAEEFLGVSRQRLSALLTGSRNMGDDFARRMEEKFDRPPDWLDVQHPEDEGQTTRLMNTVRALPKEDIEILQKVANRFEFPRKDITSSSSVADLQKAAALKKKKEQQKVMPVVRHQPLRIEKRGRKQSG